MVTDFEIRNFSFRFIFTLKCLLARNIIFTYNDFVNTAFKLLDF